MWTSYLDGPLPKAFADCLVNFHAGATKELPWTLLKEHFSGLAKVFADSIVNYQVNIQ